MNFKSLSVLFLVLISIFCSPALAISENKIQTLSNSDLAEMQLQKYKQAPGQILAQSAKSNLEKQMYKHEVQDLTGELEIYANYDSSTIICGKTNNGKIKLMDLDKKEHKLRSIKIKYSDISQVPGFDGQHVRIQHLNDLGIKDAEWVQEVTNDGGFVYLEDLPFSEILIDGFSGKYIKSGKMVYQDSNEFSLGATFEPDKISSISATVTPDIVESGPYDIPTDGLVGWWKFDEGSGINVSDSSGNGNHGTAIGNMDWVQVKYNYAGNFSDGSYVTTNSINLSSSFTILSTIGPILPSTGYYIIYKENGYLFQYTSENKLTFRSWNSTGSLNPPRSSSILPQSNGQIGVSYNGSAYSFICDGNVFYSIAAIDEIGNYNAQSGISRSTQSFIGSIDNLLIYDRALSEQELLQIYYDNIDNLTIQSNSVPSTPIACGTVSVPFSASGADISTLGCSVPDEVVIDGVTVRNYTETVTQYNITAEVLYTENTTMITESLTDEYYRVYIRHTPGSDFESGTVTYTAAENPILSSSLLQYDLETNNPAASLSYDPAPREFSISTGPITQGTAYNYDILCTKEGVPVSTIVSDGFGTNQIGVYGATGGATILIGSSYTAVCQDYGWDLGRAWGDIVGLAIILVILLAAVLIFAGAIKIAEVAR